MIDAPLGLTSTYVLATGSFLGGCCENSALLAYGALFTYIVGQLDLDVVADRTTDSPDALRFAELTDRTAAGRPTPDEFFDFGFDLSLTGLRDPLVRNPRGSASRRGGKDKV